MHTFVIFELQIPCGPSVAIGEGSGKRPLPLPLSSMETIAAWMEEQRGDMGLALEEPWVQPLSELMQKGKWFVRTIVKDGMSVTKQVEVVWEALHAHDCDLRRRAAVGARSVLGASVGPHPNCFVCYATSRDA